MNGLTWTCHVCGEERPDDAISVLSTRKFIGDVPVQTNVRYCNDRPQCAIGASDVNFLKNSERGPDGSA